MLAKCFEDLEIWKEARRLTKEIYRLILVFVVKSKARRFLSCQTLRKDSSEVETRSSGNFFTSQKVLAVKYVRNCMWQLTRDMSQQRNRKS